MVLNMFEESEIDNDDLPENWKSKNEQEDLDEFLQRNWEQRSVFYEDGKVDSKQQFLGFTGHLGLRTKKYIGTVVYNGEQINIYPKVFKKSAADYKTDKLTQTHLMNNLVKWLEYCNKIANPFISVSTEFDDSENLKELFISLYVGYVRSAIERGYFYKYVEETEDVSCIKGKFDVKDYYLNKIPNGQMEKFKCTYSTFEFDNMVNRIIKCTCKILLNLTKSRRNRQIIHNILVRLNEVSDYACKPSDCDRIRLSKMNGNYRIIISMSKMFLLNQTSSYAVDMNESFCFLFPTDLLFEGFIGGFLQEIVEKAGGKAYLQKSDEKLVDSVQIEGQEYDGIYTMRHDILVELDNKVFILDTKYKSISRFYGNPAETWQIIGNETHQKDVYQVCEYARKRGASDVYLLYPQFRLEDIDASYPVAKSSGIGGDIFIHYVRLPFVFENDENQTKLVLKTVITDVLGI